MNFKTRFHEQYNISTASVNKNISHNLFYHQPPTWFEEHYPEIRNKQWICISRNPYSRYVSWFFFIKKRQREGNNKVNWEGKSFEYFVKKDLIEKARTNEKYQIFASQGGLWDAGDAQSFWLRDKTSMKSFRLEDQLPEMEEYTKTKFIDSNINTTNHGSWEPYYTEELKGLVYEKYSEDFTNFGYSR